MRVPRVRQAAIKEFETTEKSITKDLKKAWRYVEKGNDAEIFLMDDRGFQVGEFEMFQDETGQMIALSGPDREVLSDFDDLVGIVADWFKSLRNEDYRNSSVRTAADEFYVESLKDIKRSVKTIYSKYVSKGKEVSIVLRPESIDPDLFLVDVPVAHVELDKDPSGEVVVMLSDWAESSYTAIGDEGHMAEVLEWQFKEVEETYKDLME